MGPFLGIFDPPGWNKKYPKMPKLYTTVSSCLNKISWEMGPLLTSGLLFLEFGPNFRPENAPFWAVLGKQKFSQITLLRQFLVSIIA